MSSGSHWLLNLRLFKQTEKANIILLGALQNTRKATKFDKLTNSQALLPSEQKRWTEPWWEILIFDVIFDELTNSQAFLPSKQKRWTEPYWEILIFHVMFDELTNSQALLPNEQKRW
jgi:hypothetical protein